MNKTQDGAKSRSNSASNTPVGRTTRSDSSLPASNSVNLNDVKHLLDDCKQQLLASFQVEIQKVTDALGNMNSKIMSIESELRQFRETARRHEEAITLLKSDMENSATKMPDALLQEVDDRMYRMNNVAIFGIEEANGSIQERIAHYTDQVESLLDALDVKMELKPMIAKVQRIGRPNNGKPRVLRLTFKDCSSKFTLLHESKKLR